MHTHIHTHSSIHFKIPKGCTEQDGLGRKPRFAVPLVLREASPTLLDES